MPPDDRRPTPSGLFRRRLFIGGGVVLAVGAAGVLHLLGVLPPG
jgi:hypothetical protein